MPRLVTIILGAIALIAAVVGIRSLMYGGASVEEIQADKTPTLDRALPGTGQVREGMQVAVRRSVAETRPLFISISGRTEAAQTAEVKANVTGTVTSTPAVEGTVVEKDTLLCGLDVDGANAKVREAEMAMQGKKDAYDYSVKRFNDGWVSEAFVKAAKAVLDTAQVALDVAKAEQRKAQMRAPFRGVFEKRVATVGQFLGPGSTCGIVVQLDPIVVVADASEREAAQIQVGTRAKLRLSGGSEVEGQVIYLARTADASRNFRLKVELANPNNAIPVGRVAEIKVQIGMGDAHRVSPQLLTPDEQGRIGVRYLDVGGVVSFVPADIIDETSEGTWVAGLPREALLVAEGQDNVKAGLRVTPKVIDETPAPTGGG